MTIEDILRKAGFSGDSLPMARAVLMAESHGNADAHNPNASTGDNSYGLFQINMLGNLGPDRLKRYGLSSNDDLYDPLTNAKVAYRMSNGGKDWSPWSTYKNGAYKQYLNGKGGDVKGGAVSPSGGTSPMSLDGGGSDLMRQALLANLMQQNAAFAGGKPSDPTSGLQMLQTMAVMRKLSSGSQGLTGAPTSAQTPSAGTGSFKAATGVKFTGNTTGLKPEFMNALGQAVKSLGASEVVIESGYRDPGHNQSVGGVSHSNHLTGDAIDGYVIINGQRVPLGTALKAVASKYGLRSGDTPGFYNGNPDPNHVDDGQNMRA